MRMILAAASAAAAAACAGCYGPMYTPPYGYASPGYPGGAYGTYPGPVNTLTPGTQYAPGAGGSTLPNNGLQSTPYYNNSTGGSAPIYNPPSSNSATRPAPTYSDPSDTSYQIPDTRGGNPLGYVDGESTLQRASGESFSTDSQPVPMRSSIPLSATPMPPAGSGAAPSDWQLPDSSSVEGRSLKVVLPPIPVTYRTSVPKPAPAR